MVGTAPTNADININTTTTNNNSKNNSNKDSTTKNNKDNKTTKEDSSNGDYKTIKDAEISGFAGFNNNYKIFANNNKEEYNCTANNPELLGNAKNYDEISVTIYYTEDNDTKTIVKYELYNNETNEKLENIEDENDLRKALGYYSEGSYEETLKLIEKNETPGVGSDGETSYKYYNYVFQTKGGKELEFKYKIYDDTDDKSDTLVENKDYKVKFNVAEDAFGFDYENVITDIKEI